jgi:uncharacterized membrane protein
MDNESDLRAKVARLEARVDALEGRTRPAFDLTPPPVIQLPSQAVRLVAIQSAVNEPTPQEIANDTERQFGAKVLPWLGALAIILGLGYLVNYAIERDLITPQMQMAGAAILSVAMVILGIFASKPEEEANKQFFGNLLVGLGSCGLYMTAGGGYAGWKLISAETMVGAFVGLSMLNLLYGFWRSLPPFVGLGMVGGATAAEMLASRHDHNLAMGVLALIGIPALATHVARRQPNWVFPSWAAVLVVLASWTYPGPPAYALYFTAGWLIVGLAAYFGGLVRSGEKFQEAFPVLMTTAATLLFFAFADRPWHAGVMSAAFGVLYLLGGSRLSSHVSVRRCALALGAALISLAAPWGVEPSYQILVFAGLGLALLALSGYLATELAIFGAIDLVLGFAFYMGIALGSDKKYLPFAEEWLAPILMTVAGTAMALTYRFGYGKDREAFREAAPVVGVGGSLLIWGLVSRFIDLKIDAHLLGGEWMTISWGIFAVAALAIGVAAKLSEFRWVGIGVLLFTLARLILVELASLDSALKVALLMGIGTLILGVSYVVYIRPGSRPPRAF